MNLYTKLIDLNAVAHVINPVQSDALRGLYIRQTKNDAKDAFIIAELMAIQNGKIKATEETSQAAQTLVKSLCGVVSEWAEEPPEDDSATLSG